MKKQEWFEDYGTKKIPPSILNNLDIEEEEKKLDDWQDFRLVCLRLAVEELPKKEKQALSELNPQAIKTHISQSTLGRLRKKAIKTLKNNILVQFFVRKPN